MRFSRAILIVTLVLSFAAFAQDAPIRITQQEAVKAAVSKVQPEYPPFAKQLKVSGSVELQALVDEDGKVDDVKILAGNPILTAPSVKALKRWRFTPFTSNGKPVKALAPVEFNFHMEN